MRWTVLVAMKALPGAKSRLLDGAPDGPGHARLVTAIRHDTVTAAAAADGVARVVPVVDQAGVSELESFVQRTPGLNAGLSEAAAWAMLRWPEDGVAALVGDLPALRPAELAAALVLAAESARAYVADTQGTGTTLLTARPGARLEPQFGPHSAERHLASGAARLDVGPGLRTDVDTTADLRSAGRVGLGRATAAVVAGPESPESPGVHLGTA
jgi:2-phospho-L-lactate guanylyltransferase